MSQAIVWTGKPLQPPALAALDGLAEVMVSVVGERDDWYAEASQADAIIVEGATFVTGEVMDRIGPRLRIIARTGIGVDRIDLDAATQSGILVLNTPDGPTESTAEHAIALLLNLCKGVMETDRMVRAGRFPALVELTPGFEVSGAVLGLVGLGRIGSRVASIARVLGMTVIAYDPFIAPERAAALGVELAPSLAALLLRAQIVSLHSPATLETRHMINAETLRLMPPGSYLINVARGALIDETALIDALRSGHLAGAALDVYDPEPPSSANPLFTLPNTICTPHIASYTAAGVLRMQVLCCQQIAMALRREKPTHLVNGEAWGRRRA